MVKKEVEPKVTKTLVDRVNETEGLHAVQTRQHYLPIARLLDKLPDTIKGYQKQLETELGIKYATPDQLHLALIKHMGATGKELDETEKASLANAKKVEDINPDILDKIRNHLNINYGIQDENQLHDLLDVYSKNKYEGDEEVRAAMRSIAARRGQHEVTKRASAWANQKEWPTHTGDEGSHKKFMEAIAQHYHPEIGVPDVDTYMRPDRAIGYIGEAASHALEVKERARRKIK